MTKGPHVAAKRVLPTGQVIEVQTRFIAKCLKIRDLCSLAHARAPVKLNQLLHDGVHSLPRDRRARRDDVVKQCLVGQSFHDDQPVDRLAFASQRESVIQGACDGPDTDVDVGRKRFVDGDFSQAGLVAGFACPMVEMPTDAGFLKLVGARLGKENERSMSFDNTLGREKSAQSRLEWLHSFLVIGFGSCHARLDLGHPRLPVKLG